MDRTGADYCGREELKEERDAFAAAVILMLMMMVIRSCPLSCEANFSAAAAAGDGKENPPPPTRMQIRGVLQSRCLFIQTESICRHSRNFRGETSHFSSHSPPWRPCGNNGRVISGRSRSQMCRSGLLWGPYWFILTPQRQEKMLKKHQQYVTKSL